MRRAFGSLISHKWFFILGNHKLWKAAYEYVMEGDGKLLYEGNGKEFMDQWRNKGNEAAQKFIKHKASEAKGYGGV